MPRSAEQQKAYRQTPERRFREQRRAARPRAIAKLTINLAREPKPDLTAPEPRRLPLTRGECDEVQRPCPHVTCRWHLYLDVKASGNITLNFPDIEPDAM